MQQYIDDHESDFIQFKTQVLLEGVKNDPIKQSEAITDVVKSIAVIPDAITRSVYAKECSRLFGVSEQMLLREIKKHIDHNKEEAFKQAERDKRRKEAEAAIQEPHDPQQPVVEPATDEALAPKLTSEPGQSPTYREERDVAKLIIKYGMCYLADTEYEDGTRPTTVVEHIYNELTIDYLSFSDPTFASILSIALNELERFYQELPRVEQEANVRNQEDCEREIQNIDLIGKSIDWLENEQNRIRSKYDLRTIEQVNVFRQNFLERLLCSYPDDRVREMSCRLASEPYQLSKIHTQYAHVLTDFERLPILVPTALNNLKLSIVNHRIENIKRQIKETTDYEAAKPLLLEQQKLQVLRLELAKLTGERVINP